MRRIEKSVNGHNFTFVNGSRGNRSGFVHETDLFTDGRAWPITSAKIQYYNRTWESYTFQSCMRKAVRQVVEDLEAEAIAAYKETNGRKRLSQDEKEKIYNADEKIRLYGELYAAL